jgi:DNA replication protein DnaC
VLFVTQIDLIEKLHAARATGLYERKFQQFVPVPRLFIDDFALKPLRAPRDEDAHDLGRPSKSRPRPF